MTTKERSIIGFVLVSVVLIITTDIFGDARSGGQWWHIALESLIALTAIIALFKLIKGNFSLKTLLHQERLQHAHVQKDAEIWREKAKSMIEGLSHAIVQQLELWQLTPAEQEVAFLLLKGFSLKEIATIRNTSEKTARAQSMAIYAKSGLSGRSALAAFFSKIYLYSTSTNKLPIQGILLVEVL